MFVRRFPMKMWPCRGNDATQVTLEITPTSTLFLYLVLSRLSMTELSSELAAACVYEEPCVALLLMTDQRVRVSFWNGGLFSRSSRFLRLKWKGVRETRLRIFVAVKDFSG